MRRYIYKRLLQLIPILIGMSFLVFLLMYISPGDPAQKKLTAQGVAVSSEIIEKTQIEMGLNQPFIVQYLKWLCGVLSGDFGLSFKDGTPVTNKLLNSFQYTLVLTTFSLLIAIFISLPLGILSAIYKNKPLDYAIRMLSYTGNAIPNFMVAIFLMYFLCIRNDYFPIIAKGSFKGLLLPALSLGLPLSGRLIRQVRVAVLEQLSAPYVTGLKARGIKWRLILLHNILRNAMASIFTVIGVSVGTLMSGSVVIENLFLWPGVGRLVMTAISDRDYPLIQGVVMVIASVYVIINLLVDIGNRILDPRVRD